MSETPPQFVRVSLPHGHFTVPAVTAARAGWKVLKQDALDKFGRPRAPQLRVDLGAAAPTHPEADASDNTPKE